MKKSILSFCFFGVVAIFAVGCETIQIPTNSKIHLINTIPNAPTAVALVRDLRGSDKMGRICLDSIKAKKEDVELLASQNLKQFLFDRDINMILTSEANLTTPENRAKLISSKSADILVLFEIHKIRVSSFDLILDPPEYQLNGTVNIFTYDGSSIVNSPVSSGFTSQAVSAKGKGESVDRLIREALLSLETNPKFSKELKMIQMLKKTAAES